MIANRRRGLCARAFYELLRYDALHGLCGVRDFTHHLDALPPSTEVEGSASEEDIVEALATAATFYWKPVRCLQRSVCLVRTLRRHGIRARLVIGYRPAPFLSHAWTAVDDRVVGDSAAYARQLQVLVTV
jgi:hypothetical protein